MNRTLSVIVFVIIGLVLFVAGFATILATTDWGQQVVTQQVNGYLAQKIKSPFRIGRIRYQIPKSVTLDEVFFQTPTGDTLLIGKRLRVDLEMWGLMSGRVALNDIDLEHVRLNLARTLPDTTYNFQYLLDAFLPKQPKEPVKAADSTAKPLAISLSGLTLRDVRVRYVDDVLGVNVDSYVAGLRAEFDNVDVAKSAYFLKNTRVTGLTVKARTYTGLPVPTKPTRPGDTLALGLGTWTVDKASWDIRAETAGVATKGAVGQLRMDSDYLYLTGQKIGLRSLTIAQSDISATLLKVNKKPGPTTANKILTPAPTAPNAGWRAALEQLTLTNNRIRYDDQNAPVQRRGIDYGHLDLRGLSLTGQALRYAPEQTSGRIRNGKVREKSGLNVEQLAGDALYASKLTSVRNLLLQTTTPTGGVGTLLRNQITIRYDSVGQLGRVAEPSVAGRTAASRVRVGLDLRQSRLAISDLLLVAPFVAQYPPFSTTRTGVIRANVRANGTLAAMDLPVFEVDLLTGTRIRASGRLTNLTDPNRLGTDLLVKEAVTNRADLLKLTPPGSLPNTIALPPSVRVSGRLRGKLNDLTVQAQAGSAWGNAEFSGRLAGFVPSVAAGGQTYAGTATLTNFDAGKWLKNPKQFGRISGRATVNGSGIDPKTLRTSFRADVDEATVNGYRYQQISANGQFVSGLLTIKGTSNDPNARLTLDTKVDLNPGGRASAFPSVTGQVNLRRLDLNKLGFYAEPLELVGDLDLNLSSTDPNQPEGTVRAQNATVRLGGQSYPLDQVFLSARTRNGRKSVTIEGPSVQMELDGQFDYTKLYDIVVGEISRYFVIPDLNFARVPPPYDFAVNAKIYQSALLRAFVPALSRLDTMRLTAYLDNTKDTTLSATLTGGTVIYDSSTIQSPNLSLRGTGERLLIGGRIGEAESGAYRLGLTTLTGTATGNRLDFRVLSKDSVKRDRYGLTGQVGTVDGNYQLRLARTGLLTNYIPWQADTTGYLQYGRSGILANNFTIGTGFGRADRQAITVSSTEPYGNAPIRITTQRVELGFLSKIIQQDTTLASGQLNGTVVVRDYAGSAQAAGSPNQPKLSFFGSFYVDSLRVMQQPIGNITSRFTNADGGRVGVNVELTGQNNDATLAGFYNPQNVKQALDFQVNLQRLDARTIQAFSFGELRRASGKLTGQFSVGGAVNEPKIDGSVAFDSVAINIRQLNATYRIDKQTVRFNAPTITLNNLAIRDSLDNTLITSGTVTLRKLPDVAYDLRVSAAGFQVLNATRKDNDYAYGQARVSATLRIRGSGTSPSIIGDVKLEDGSKISVVLPDQAATVNQARDVVTFIDHKDTLALAKYLVQVRPDSLRRPALEQLSNANISLNLEATEKSELTIVLDELNGDFLQAKGNARFNVGLDAAGNLTVLGRYEITEGVYALTYEILKRQFQLQPGGSITFSGDPYKADIDITAVYKTTAVPDALVGNESVGTGVATKQKMPFNVQLGISGNLTAPTLKFDITQPKGDNLFAQQTGTQQLVEQKLTTLRTNQSEMNKQVFGLLLLNSFIPDNISDAFSSGTGGGIGGSAENLARNSVSQILSEQLQRFASGLLKGVDVNLNLSSSNASGTGTQGRTNLGVGLSKNFLNGRLSVSVGRNFALDNTSSITRNPADVFDNVSLNYNLSADGRYALRAYRRNNFQSDQAIVEGYVIETGVGFVVTVEYNTLQELLRKKGN